MERLFELKVGQFFCFSREWEPCHLPSIRGGGCVTIRVTLQSSYSSFFLPFYKRVLNEIMRAWEASEKKDFGNRKMHKLPYIHTKPHKIQDILKKKEFGWRQTVVHLRGNQKMERKTYWIFSSFFLLVIAFSRCDFFRKEKEEIEKRKKRKNREKNKLLSQSQL